MKQNQNAWITAGTQKNIHRIRLTITFLPQTPPWKKIATGGRKMQRTTKIKNRMISISEYNLRRNKEI
jgi:hypothetical protein